ncbi:uncharacterized protein LOC124279120 [Haliotis rubra]|uniref:uncharacterized protein LOC124279120 n=1 Tax=Haliotis rubra TaxID=36100 RepID=UPI001EE51BAD|nr:uncharacterized protein LOC124279120 [Haliotis rubra]
MKMQSLSVLMLMCVLMFTAVTDAGASRGQIRKILGPVIFRHIVCYSCGAHFGITKGWCDYELKARLAKTCEQAGLGCSYRNMKRKKLGRVKYQKNPKPWCKHNWVRKYF